MKPFHRDLSIALGWFVFDQLTKYAASQGLAGGSVLLVENFLRFTLSHNRGALFGAFNDLPDPWRLILLAGIPILAIVGIFVFLMKVPRNETFARIGLALILGGAVGNVLDRLVFGYVVDFIDVYAGWEFCRMWFVDVFGTNRWPTFNVADIGLCVGATLLIIEVFIKRAPEDADSTDSAESAETQTEDGGEGETR